jgi:hypothetical protein
MRTTLLCVAAMLLLSPFAPASPPPPAPSLPDPTGLLVHADADGNRTVTLAIEDGDGGAFMYTGARTLAQVPQAREGGVYAHSWTSSGGSPMLTLGTYFVTDSQRTLRVPAVIVENVSSIADVNALVTLFATRDVVPYATNLEPFLLEFLLPELSSSFGWYPGDNATFHSDPTIYVWTLHRTTGAGELWSGAYLLRQGSATPPGARPFHAEKLVDVGAAVRQGGVTTRVAGAWARSVIDSDEPGAATDVVTAGATAADARTALVSLVASDAREGDDPVLHPTSQEDQFTLGVHDAGGAFVPLLGARTTLRYAANGALSDGTTRYDTTRITSLGVFVAGDYTPLAGFRTHSDTGDVLETAASFVDGALGDEGTGNVDVDVGAFPDGEYAPLAGAIHRNAFPRQAHERVSLVAVGVYGPTGFEGLLAASYDGSSTFLQWAIDSLSSNDVSDAWRIAAGAYLLGAYEPVIGVEDRPDAPAGQYSYQRALVVGVFAGDYGVFVPLASAAYDAPLGPVPWALAFAAGGPGAPTGGFDARVGAHAPDGSYVPLVGAQYRDDAPERTAPSEASLVFGVYAPDFTPVAGLAYWGAAPLVTTLGATLNTRDDQDANVAVGVFVQGRFVDVVTVHNDGNGTSVTAGPTNP